MIGLTCQILKEELLSTVMFLRAIAVASGIVMFSGIFKLHNSRLLNISSSVSVVVPLANLKRASANFKSSFCLMNCVCSYNSKRLQSLDM
ncbi:4-diphosphocytidyl-2-C-methyl-D-erythritol kinase [Frankliniella fusca]|uniref:4-diphosphocytidyl-2-C-methyl-D-erythritol kinase n=1 Tax=Frankliniella fusca TaxID=407009 RepID=A0AAE1LG57_9NEOP|nr:4-diphosphocytidyl-2-C-methyl-D-erythritol kinase [Frankliniella fusca]